MIAMLPTLQRERAGFIERLGQYLALPAPKKTFSVIIGKKTVKADYLILGDPIEWDPKGNLKDIPLALFTIELLARLGQLTVVPSAVRALSRLLADCDEQGVWYPRTLKNQPKAPSKATYHWYPLQPQTKEAERKVADVTIRLAVIAKLLGWQLNRT